MLQHSAHAEFLLEKIEFYFTRYRVAQTPKNFNLEDFSCFSSLAHGRTNPSNFLRKSGTLERGINLRIDVEKFHFVTLV